MFDHYPNPPKVSQSLPLPSAVSSLTLPIRSMTMPLPIRRHMDFSWIPTEPVSGTRRLPPIQWALVGLTVCIMVATWSIMAESLQGLNKGYKKPLSTVCMVQWGFAIVCAPIWAIWKFYFLRNLTGSNCQPEDFFTWKELFVISAFTSSFQLGTRYTWYLSLVGTSVAANSIIWQSACVLVYILSVPLLKTPVTWMKSGAVLFSVCGAAFVMGCTTTASVDEPNGNQNPQSPLGYLFLFISLFLFALYEVANKRWAQSEDDPFFLFNCVRLLLAIGITGGLLCTPIIAFVHFLGIETFEWPGKFTPLLLLNILLDSAYNLSLLMCVALTSPLFASIGGILVVPVTVTLDWYLHGLTLPALAYLGMTFIFIGFAAMNVAEYVEREESVRFRDRDRVGVGPPNAYASLN